MTRYEVITLNCELLRKMYELGINTGDFRFVQIFDEYNDMLQSGEKTTYIATVLSQRHAISERSVYRIISFMKEHC